MTELAQALIAESAHATPANILEALPEDLARRVIDGVPHSIYQELWHLAYWQEITLNWISGIETAYPAKMTDAFPDEAQGSRESWAELCRRFLDGAEQAASIAEDHARLSTVIRCPSRPGRPIRFMTVQDQLLSLAAHNAYHLGRIVLLRQLAGAWPPPSGGFAW